MKQKWYTHQVGDLFFIDEHEAREYEKIRQYVDDRRLHYYAVNTQMGVMALGFRKYEGRKLNEIRPGELYLYLEWMIKYARQNDKSVDSFAIRLLCKYFNVEPSDFRAGS